MLTFPGGAPIGSVAQMPGAYGAYGGTASATNAYGTPMFPSSGSYAM